MTTVKRSDFVQQNQGKALDLGRLEQDAAAKAELGAAGLTTQALRRADQNADGVLSPDEAFSAADRFDTDGNAQSLLQFNPDGQFSKAGNAAASLGLVMGRHGLQPAPNRVPGADVPAAPKATPAAGPKSNDEILMVGMNNPTRMSAGSEHELKELQKGGAKVTYIKDSKAGPDKIKVGGTTYDLTAEAGRTGFAATLGLPADQQKKVADAIGMADENGKDELAQIAQVWARGERGESMPSRMILSGHHVGSGVYGDHNGKLNWEAVTALSKAMPTAAGKVEDLHISACYSGGEEKRAMYREIFPNAKTIWAYSGSAPGAGSGAVVHQAAWERATRGQGVDVAEVAEGMKSRGVRKADVIYATRTEASAGIGPPLAELKAPVDAGDPVFARHFTGQAVQANPQTGPLRDYYNGVQRLLQHPDLKGDERKAVEARRDQTIRTLFYSSAIAPRFADSNEYQIKEGYGALGLPVPDFAKLTRAEAMESITLFRTRLDYTNPKPAAAERLLGELNGLWNLDNNTIPEHWI